MTRVSYALAAFLFTWAVEAKNIVFWLSIDGLSPAYLEKAKVPHLKKLLNKSIFTTQLRPAFPSITFPSHCSQATGVKVKEHGIPFNTFYDSKTKTIESYPNDSQLLQAEPIWQTVKKGQLRSAVFNWPLSFNQTGKDKADYFYDKYEKDLSDEERIDRALTIWQEDLDKGRQLDLIMAYVVGPDSVGHKYGPHSKKVLEAMVMVDQLVAKIQTRIRQVVEARKDRGDSYYLLLTTDHGMTEVQYGVNFSILCNQSQRPGIRLLPGGSVGHVFLNDIPKSQRSQTIKDIKREVKKYQFASIHEKNKLPPTWGYDHPTRVGDLVITLDKGYSFVNNAPKVVSPISEIGGPLGIHGYDAVSVSEMYGFMALWKYPEIPHAIELKETVEALQLHPTVAAMLKVKPSEKADAEPIKEVIHLIFNEK